MIKESVDKINNKASEFIFLELSIFHFDKDELIIAASEDFSYYHNFEIRFKNVFAIIGNVNWKVDTQESIIQVLENNEDAYRLNMKYSVEIGNTIFQFITEENKLFYIIAESIEFVDKVVKYWS